MSNPQHVCPWWMAYTFDNPLRHLIHNPTKMFKDLVRPGMTALDIGCGMGYFSLGLAEIVGETGRVIAVDLQEQMLRRVRKRARRAGIADRIETRICTPESIGVSEPVDFVLAFWMVHETPSALNFFKALASILKPDGKILVTEPKFHVTESRFEDSLTDAQLAGLRIAGRPEIALGRSAILALAA